MDEYRQAYQIRKYINDEGKPQVDFECPICKQWSPVAQHDGIRALTFKCTHCEFEENTSLDTFSEEEIN